jgi:hypothetical protein
MPARFNRRGFSGRYNPVINNGTFSSRIGSILFSDSLKIFRKSSSGILTESGRLGQEKKCDCDGWLIGQKGQEGRDIRISMQTANLRVVRPSWLRIQTHETRLTEV